MGSADGMGKLMNELRRREQAKVGD